MRKNGEEALHDLAVDETQKDNLQLDQRCSKCLWLRARLPLHAKDGTKSKPFCWTQSNHVGQVSHVPKYDILLLDSLIVFIIRELPTGAEAPGNVFTPMTASPLPDAGLRSRVGLPPAMAT